MRRERLRGIGSGPRFVQPSRSKLVALAAEKGQAAASSEFPDVDIGQTIPPGVGYLVERANADVATGYVAAQEALREPQIKFRRRGLRRERQDARIVELTGRQRERRHQLSEAAAKLPEDGESARSNQVLANMRAMLGLLLPVAVLGVLGWAEYSMNKTLYQLLGANKPDTKWFTIGTGVALLYGSHFLGGERLRRVHDTKASNLSFQARVRTASGIGAALLFSLVGCLVMVMLLRGAALEQDIEQLPGEPALTATEGVLLFGALQFLFNVIAYAIGYHTHSEATVAAVRASRVAEWWIRLRLSLAMTVLRWLIQREAAAAIKLATVYRQYAAAGRQARSVYLEAIAAFYDTFSLSAGVERAAVLAAQTYALSPEPAWILEYEFMANFLSSFNQVPVKPLSDKEHSL